MTTKVSAAAARFRTLIFRPGARALRQDTARQREAYSYWYDTPEVRFSALWVGRAMSKARLFAGERMEDGTIVEVEKRHPAAGLVTSIAGGPTGQSQLLAAFGPHLVVAGEGWVVVVPQPDTDTADWFPLSVREVDRSGNKMTATVVIDGEEQEINVPPANDSTDPNAPLAIRIWDPHPERYIRADSPVMSSTVILDELRLLNAAVAAIAKSRLLGRGVFLVPEGTKLADGDDDLLERFIDVAEMAYQNPDAAAAGVPVILEIPKGAGMEPKHITFESSFDELAIKLREEAISRYATASDTPAEVLLGKIDINHWGVWAIRDEAIEIGIEPRLATVCDGLTSQWLWPALESKNVKDPRTFVVWYDTSQLRVRTNRSQTAIELGRDRIISPKAVRRETGFEEDDAPPTIDAAVELALTLVERAPSLMADVGLSEIVQQIRDVLSGAQVAPPSSGGDVKLPVDETQAPPGTEPTGELPSELPGAAACETLSAAVDGLIVRALERAGNKLRTSRPRSEWGRLKNAQASTYHVPLMPTLTEVDGLRLLDGAWDRVPEVASRYGVREDCLTGLLDTYVRDLLVAGVAHAYANVPMLVQEAACLQLA